MSVCVCQKEIGPYLGPTRTREDVDFLVGEDICRSQEFTSQPAPPSFVPAFMSGLGSRMTLAEVFSFSHFPQSSSFSFFLCLIFLLIPIVSGSRSCSCFHSFPCSRSHASSCFLSCAFPSFLLIPILLLAPILLVPLLHLVLALVLLLAPVVLLVLILPCSLLFLVCCHFLHLMVSILLLLCPALFLFP